MAFIKHSKEFMSPVRIRITVLTQHIQVSKCGQVTEMHRISVTGRGGGPTVSTHGPKGLLQRLEKR